MKVPDNILSVVVFVTYLNHITNQHVPVGTAFFIGADPLEGKSVARTYAVTAKHVIDALKRKGVTELYLRHNLSAPVGDATMGVQAVGIEKWVTHPTDETIDVAIAECGVPAACSERVLPFSLCATDDRLKADEVDLGDEVFVVGLFRHHTGKKRNIPIVRVGNLAARNEERISTKLGEMDAYLIEARSIGGISGSPVFLNLGITRSIGGSMMQSPTSIFYAIGLIHGHFDVLSSELASSLDSSGGLDPERINSGIAIVTPIHHVRSLIEEYEKRVGGLSKNLLVPSEVVVDTNSGDA